MRDLWDTAAGFLGMATFMWLYQHNPMMAMGYVGFHIGVMSMRMTRGYFLRSPSP